MSKRSFIKSLIERIDFLELEEINSIVKEYEDIIDKRTKNGEKLKDVIKSFGDIDTLAKNILKERRKSKASNIKESFQNFWSKEKKAIKRTFSNFFGKFKRKDEKTKKSKDKKVKKETDKKNKNSSFKYKFTTMLNNFKNREKKTKKSDETKSEEVKEKDEKIKEEIEEHKEKSQLKKDKAKKKKKNKSKKNGIKNQFNKFISKFKKSKKKKNKKNKAKKEKKIKTDEKSVQINIEVKKKNKAVRNVFAYIFIILLFLNSVLFFTSVIGYVDGVKILGAPLSFLSISIIYLLVVLNIDDFYHFGKLNKNIKLTIVIIVILFFSFSISLMIYEIYNINYVNDASEKYTIIKTSNKIEVDEKTKKYNIYFNSFYKTNYDVVIDEKLGNTIKIEVKYYECMNDLIYKTSKDSVYVSLTENARDLISFYIENLKENTIYNYKELSRYEVIISMSSKLKEKVKIHD